MSRQRCVSTVTSLHLVFELGQNSQMRLLLITDFRALKFIVKLVEFHRKIRQFVGASVGESRVIGKNWWDDLARVG